ncbi:MAG: hypothetical protein CMQ82_03175 [Gammaproteobacteria bacterium]|nr:hypothetical protein [Gammaproteobacteria bacterium]RPG34865.1 MAG: outer membrane protein assembly factor BamC [Gammaproteobacteria bacterium TMED193]
MKKIIEIIFYLTVISSCAGNDFINVDCERGNCTAERADQNERLGSEGEQLVLSEADIDLDISNDFPYPDKGQSFLKEGEIPRPKKIFSSTGSEIVEIRRLGEIYWIYSESLPSKTWPLIKDYLSSGFDLIEESPDAGIIKSTIGGSDEQLNIRLEHGIKNNSSEIYLSDKENQTSDISFFNEMASFIQENLPGYQGNSIAAQSLNLNKKARIVYVRKEIGIEFKLSFERTWSALSRALERTEYIVVDRNRDLRYIQLDIEEDAEGFFNFFGSNETDQKVDYELTFTKIGDNTLLEFKKLSDIDVSVNELVDKINENLS